MNKIQLIKAGIQQLNLTELNELSNFIKQVIQNTNNSSQTKIVGSEFKDTMIDPVPSHLKTPTHNHPDVTHPHDMDDFPTPGGDISHEKIVHQLRTQGVSERNVESMAADIVRQHYSSGISIHNVDHTKKQVNKAKNYYDPSNPMSGINNELVSSTVYKSFFKH